MNSALLAHEVDSPPEDRAGTRIRAFLARTRPLKGTTWGDRDAFWEGRALIEQLALALDMRNPDYHWSPAECAAVLTLLHAIEPHRGACYCDENPDERISITRGYHAVLEFMAEEMARFEVTQFFGRLEAVFHA